MVFFPDDATPELLEVPVHACDPVRSALSIIHKDIVEMGGPSNDSAQDVYYHTLAANKIAGACGSLCTSGCVRDLHFRAQSTGIELPASAEREELFELVSGTLASSVLFGEDNNEEKPQVVVIEMSTGGSTMKEIYSRRIDLFSNTEFLETLVAAKNIKNPDKQFSIEDMQLALKQTLTPINEDFWDPLADFCRGNIRAAMSIILYLHQVCRIFRGTDVESKKLAENISKPYVVRDEGYRKEYTGFTPVNPQEISAAEVEAIARLVDDEGTLSLPLGYGVHTFMRIHEKQE
jgi:hypothetical protein